MSRLPLLALIGSFLIAVTPLAHAQSQPSSTSPDYQPRDFQVDGVLRGRVQVAIKDAVGRDASRIVIDVRRGHVYLSGKVRDARTRALAHDAARGVPGVTGVSVRRLYASRW